jgi:hypothetical protein
MTKDEALKLALEFVENSEGGTADLEAHIKEALAQPEQKPVGKFAKFTDGIWREVTDGSAGVLLYTTPQHTWVGLTDEEVLKFQDIVPNTLSHDLIEFAQAIEAKLKEKNT